MSVGLALCPPSHFWAKIKHVLGFEDLKTSMRITSEKLSSKTPSSRLISMMQDCRNFSGEVAHWMIYCITIKISEGRQFIVVWKWETIEHYYFFLHKMQCQMFEIASETTSNAWKSFQNDSKCVKKFPKLYQMCEKDIKCAKKSPKWH